MFRGIFQLLLAGAMFVQLGVVRPCFLDEAIASWFNHAPACASASTDPGNVRTPSEDANSPVPEHRPGVSHAQDDSVGQMHKFMADISLIATFEPLRLADLSPVVQLEATADSPALPCPVGAVTLPLLI